MEGFVKIHRKLQEWEWYDNSNMVHLFLHLLLSANHDDKYWRGIPVKRGQLITGLYSLSKNTGISIQTLRTCLERLKSTGEITNKSTNRFRIITIIKWEQYQIREKIQQAKTQTQKHTTNNQLTTNKNVKNDKNLFIGEKQIKFKRYFKGVWNGLLVYEFLDGLKTISPDGEVRLFAANPEEIKKC